MHRKKKTQNTPTFINTYCDILASSKMKVRAGCRPVTAYSSTMKLRQNDAISCNTHCQTTMTLFHTGCNVKSQNYNKLNGYVWEWFSQECAPNDS